MAEVVKLIQGSQELVLTSGDYRAQEVFLNPSADRELWHEPDQGERRMVRSEAADRSCTIKVRVPISVTDEDALQDAVVAIRRYLNEATRYELKGDNSAVYLQLQKDTATNAVKHRIKSGWVDDSASHYRAERTGAIEAGTSQALDIFINLVLAPYGEWTSTITLANAMFSSPHFVEDSGAAPDGLADGWVEVGAPATSIDTTAYLIGGQSQKVVTDGAGTDGIQCDTVTIAQASDIVSYAWVYVASGDPVTVTLRDGGANTIESKAVSVGNSDKTAVDSAGNTWLRISCSGANDDAADTYLHIARLTGDAAGATTYYVDGCYIGLDTTTVPDAWMSSLAIDNRNDPQDTSQATENYINYVDLWGIPGDAAALTEFRLTGGASSAGDHDILVASSIADGTTLAADQFHWVESDASEMQYPASGFGAWSDETGGGSTNNHYKEFVATGASDVTFYYNPGDEDVRILGDMPRRVFLLCWSDSTDITAQAFSPLGSGLALTPVRAITLASDYILLDMGLLNLSGAYPADDLGTLIGSTFYMAFNLEGVVNLDEIRIDALLLHYANQDGFLVSDFGGHSNTDILAIRGSDESVISDNIARGPNSDNLGGLWSAQVGVMNRFVFSFYSRSDDEYDVAIDNTVSAIITPRTRHLLGT